MTYVLRQLLHGNSDIRSRFRTSGVIRIPTHSGRIATKMSSEGDDPLALGGLEPMIAGHPGVVFFDSEEALAQSWKLFRPMPIHPTRRFWQFGLVRPVAHETHQFVARR